MSAINTLKVLSIAIIPNLQWRRIDDAMAVVFNLWRAVKSAKNIVHDNIPSSLTLGGIAVHPGDVANSFAKHFHSKVNNLLMPPKSTEMFIMARIMSLSKSLTGKII